MAKKHNNPRRKQPLADEIKDTEAKDQHESVSITISLLRSLYLHILVAMRDGDYNSPSAYVSDLIRRDKHIRNRKPSSLEGPLHEPTQTQEKRIGYERRHKPFLGTAANIARIVVGPIIALSLVCAGGKKANIFHRPHND